MGCGIPGRPLPPLDKETIGRGYPKHHDKLDNESKDFLENKTSEDDTDKERDLWP